MADLNPDTAVRRLAAPDAEALVALRREALEREPYSFGASPADDRRLAVDLVRDSLANDDRGATFGAFAGGALAGMLRIERMERLKTRHRAAIYGMYVRPPARGRGLGAALLGAAVACARTWPDVVQVHLSVTSASPEAARLYERFGFREWGVEPRALKWQGRYVDEHHLVFVLA